MTDEERAEEWCKNNMDICKAEGGFGEVPYFGAEERCVAKSAYLDGLHADRWHYPSRGEYPPKEQEYFVAFKTSKEIYYDVRVLNSDLNNLLLGIGEQIYAWQYIVPPQEEV